jgi:hypothetical protein
MGEIKTQWLPRAIFDFCQITRGTGIAQNTLNSPKVAAVEKRPCRKAS